MIWGDPCIFRRDNLTVKIVPLVDTGMVYHHPGDPVVGIVSNLYLLNVEGDRDKADRLLEELKTVYVL